MSMFTTGGKGEEDIDTASITRAGEGDADAVSGDTDTKSTATGEEDAVAVASGGSTTRVTGRANGDYNL